MKKLTFVLAFCFACIASLSAADVVAKWKGFTAEELTKVNAYTVDGPYQHFKCAAELEQYGKQNPAVYKDFAVFEDFVNTKIKNFKNVNNAVMMTVLNVREKFDTALLIQIVKKYKERYAIIYWPSRQMEVILPLYNNSKTDLIKDMIRVAATPHEVKEILKVINQELMIDEKPEVVIPLLKSIKRKFYVNISKSDAWKQQMVECELMIKSFE